MSKKQEEKQYRFVRIRGRVVPIAIGASSIASGFAVGSKKASKVYDKKLDKITENIASGKNQQRKLNFFSGQNFINRENSRYNKILTKALNKETGATFYGSGVGKFDPLEKRHGKIQDISYKDVRKSYMRIPPDQGRAYAKIYLGRSGIGNIHTNVRNTPIMLHELGHYIQKNRGTPVYNFFKKVQEIGNDYHMKAFNLKARGKSPQWKDYTYFRGNKKLDVMKRNISSAFKYYSNMAKFKVLEKSTMPIRSVGRFAIEQDANYQSIKMAKKMRGPKFAKITAKVAIPNILGYGKSGIIKTAKYSLIGLGLSTIYNELKHNRNKQ
jgi:hypothetical protein